MTQSSRKFVGVFAIILSIVVYAALAVAVYELLPGGLPTWLVLIYFVVAGMGWALPAGGLIKWMSRPDQTE